MKHPYICSGLKRKFGDRNAWLKILALILIGSRLHGHWFIRIVRHSPAQSVMIAGEVSCQPLWISAQQEQESDALSETVAAAAYY